MSNAPEIFLSTTKQDFSWSNAKSLGPPPPPMDQLYLPRPDPEDCRCDVHSLENKKARYKQLANKERRLRDELVKVDHEMVQLTSSMLDTRDMDEAMKSIYKTDYKKRGLPITEYRPLLAALDAPITPISIDLKDAYRDPIRFRYSAMDSSTTQPAKTIEKVSEICSFWDMPFAGCSEYKDTISRMGLSNMKNQQQYLKPLLPARKLEDLSKVI
ncbi:uncharacterized protein LOC126858556 isoform X1 [Cataglyphis hispanica]|uniref:uncharacterized protein LOC126858556 isoform X1 n=1 Tax=Cataglyphis hispanica TaxID=1086592 RepID=UPI00218036AC|nr:uncharacterized protein LOC126858556 isoform X1 [Cataglyphis hispanica]